MCRIIAGTLIEVGRHKRSPESVALALASRDRRQAGMTAPACGLTLLEVLY
jgi:tRNA pseudouridine38-40 synthase